MSSLTIKKLIPFQCYKSPIKRIPLFLKGTAHYHGPVSLQILSDLVPFLVWKRQVRSNRIIFRPSWRYWPRRQQRTLYISWRPTWPLVRCFYFYFYFFLRKSWAISSFVQNCKGQDTKLPGSNGQKILFGQIWFRRPNSIRINQRPDYFGMHLVLARLPPARIRCRKSHEGLQRYPKVDSQTSSG